jgi:predicted PurR-regulated permease PerM
LAARSADQRPPSSRLHRFSSLPRIEDRVLKDRLPNERQLPEPIDDIWAPAAQMAIVGIFVILLGACLYIGRPILLPVSAAVVVGTTLAPLVKAATRYRISPWVTAAILGVFSVAGLATAVTFLSKPVSEWVARAPEIATIVRQKLYVLDRPLSALRELREGFPLLGGSGGNTVAVEHSGLGIVTPVLAFLTPAVMELVLFFVTLIFFLGAQMDFRRYMVSFFTTRKAKLRFIRIANDIEQNLASYLLVVTAINWSLGALVAVGAWLFEFPSPVLFGILAAVLNYVPYVGAACTTIILLGAGLVTFPSVTYAFLPPAAFVLLGTIEGQFITPTILGHQLTLNPLAVLLAIAFWSWMWGPMGTFLAVPLTIIGSVTLHHLFPPDESRLPG